MQISGVSLTLTWPHRLCLLRVLLCKPLLQAFPFPSTLGEVTLHPLSQACVFVYSSRGKWVFPPLLWSFPPSVTLTSFPAPGCWVRPPPLSPAQLVYLQFRVRFPFPNLRRSVHPTLFPTCLYCSYCLLLSFSFFPGWRLVCPGGYAALARACLWEYCGTAKLTLSASSQAVWVWATGGPGALLVSPLNMKWRCSAPAGGVEGSKFCLFLVVLPARCVASISPRFHYRRHTFCFLPLAAILESPS
jgi:hypothetical protein